MKTIEIGFLSQQTNQLINETARRLFKIASPIKELKKIAADSANILNVELAVQCLEILPSKIAYRIAAEKIKDFLVFGAERNFFGGCKYRAKIALRESNIRIPNPISENSWTKAVLGSSQRLGSTRNTTAKFILSDELISSSMTKKIAALCTLDCGGYNTFWDYNNDGEYYPLLSKMDTPLNLSTEKFLTPAIVVADSIQINLLVDKLQETNFNILHKIEDQCYYGKAERKTKDDRAILEDRLYSFVQKYPILCGRKGSSFLWYLHNHYSMTPSQMARRFGYDVLCVPFDLSKNTDWVYGKDNVPKNWDACHDRKISALPLF